MNQKYTIIGIGLSFSFLLLYLPFLNWTGIEPNNDKTNLLNGINELLHRTNYLSGTICGIIGILPLIFSIILAFRKQISKFLTRIIATLFLILIIIGIYHIHRYHLIANYGKVYWTFSFGYYIYWILTIGIGILNSFLFFNTFMNNKNAVQQRV